MLLLLSLSCVEYSVEAVRDGFTPVAGEETCPPQIPDCEQPEAPDTGEMPWCEVEHADAREVPADSSCEDIPTVDEPFALHLDVHYPAKGSGVGVAPAIAAGHPTPDEAVAYARVCTHMGNPEGAIHEVADVKT